MAYSDSFPSQRPSFMFDASNAGRIPPNMTYSRSTTGTYFGAAKHLSSENLLLQSSDFDTTWSNQALSGINSGQTDPSGGTDGFTLVENGAAAFHRVYQSVSATGELALTVYAKRNTGTRYLNLTIATSSSTTGAGLATFDLSGGAAHTDNGSSSTLTGLSATQTASGNGYYKCVFKATATGATYINISLSDVAAPVSNYYGLVYYTGDNSSSIDIAFASLTTTGATDYQPTTTQIHREYAPTLQTAAINAPRFEYSASDGESAGTSLGILLEGQAQNLLPNGATGFNSSNVLSWGTIYANVTQNAAIAPTGQLEASHLYSDTTAASQHRIDVGVTTTAASHTLSGYFKTTGKDVLLRVNSGSTTYGAVFTFATESAANYGPLSNFSSLSVSSVGNGWYRFAATTPTLTAGTSYAYVNLTDGNQNFDGDGYSGVLFYGLQFEANAFASSLIATVDSAATRAADSLSMTDSSLFDNGGGALYVENKQPNATQNNSVVSITDGGSSNYVRIRGNFSNFRGEVYNNAAIQADLFGGTNDTNFHKQCITFGNNNVSFYVDGNKKGSTDTSCVIPELNTIRVGWAPIISNGNQHIRRVAVYGSQISETEAAAITK